MRFTVYGEDLRPDRAPVILREEVRDEPQRFYWGIRIFVGPDNYHRPGDDDTGAINLFMPLDAEGRPNVRPLLQVLNAAVTSLVDLTSLDIEELPHDG